MNYNDPIVYGNERDHTKVYNNERHCLNCEESHKGRCHPTGDIATNFAYRPGYPPERCKVYWGRCTAGICNNFKLIGKDWDR